MQFQSACGTVIYSSFTGKYQAGLYLYQVNAKMYIFKDKLKYLQSKFQFQCFDFIK
jgi:hypothetical protein